MKPRLVCFLLLACCFPLTLLAQDTASITGIVTDPSGAAIPNAEVVLSNPARSLTLSAVTNNSGVYSFAALPIGSYNISISAQGFKRYQAQGVTLRVADKARVDVQLQVGSATTEVVVEGVAVAQVETETSELSGTVTGKEITQLELNGRDFKQLITLVPGVTNQTGQDEGEVGVSALNSYSVNGGRTEYNNWETDGGDMLDNGSNNTLNVTPSIDAIAEFKVLSSNYGAQYGRNGSGTVEVETKSGTSTFHGDAYEFVRNNAFNATPQFLTAAPAYHKNDFGFTFGGPIFIPNHYNTDKEKTFFFVSEEWRRDRVPSTTFFSSTTVPSMAERAGDFSADCGQAGVPFQTSDSTGQSGPYFPNCPAASLGSLVNVNNTPIQFYNPFPGNQVPISNAPTVNALEALIPEPNIGTNLWYATPTLPTNWREDLFRIDQKFGEKLRGTFRYIHDSWFQQYPVPLWTSGTTFPTVQTPFSGPGVSMVARLTATASPTLLNEFVASYTTDHITTNLTGPWQRPSDMLPIGIYDNGFGGRVPGVSVTGGQYNFAEDPGYVPIGPLNSNPTYTFRDNLTKVVGAHNLQFGGYIVIAQKNEIPQPSYGTNGLLQFSTSSAVTTGNAFADLLLGNVGTFTQEESALKMYERYKIFEPYFQDDWHATKRLTLNLGLRVSLFGTYSELHRNAWNFDPSHYVVGASGVTYDQASGSFVVSGNPYNGWVQCGVTQGVPAGCMSNHWFNPAPRIGFAFDPKGDGRWAIRGGYGIFFEHTNGNEANTESLEQYNPATQTVSVVNVAGYENVTPALLGTSTTPLHFVSLPSKATWPYMQQWHLDVQHNFKWHTLATVSYVGSSGVHLTRSYEYNQMLPVPVSLNPYSSGQVISAGDCGSLALNQANAQYTGTVNGITSTGSWANNLAVACGNDPNPYRPFVGIGDITRKDQTGSSNYSGLQVAVRHSIGGLELSLAYTYSHSIDDSSDYNDAGFVNSYDLNSYRASSNFDQRHTFNLAWVYDLPFFKQPGWRNRLLGGWQWSGITTVQSGTPFSVYNLGFGSIPTDNAGVGNSFATGASYPDLVGNPSSGVVNIPIPGLGPLLYNPGAFVAPTGLTFGTAGRNILTNPSRTNFDMALLKHIAVTESKYFEFRAEAFNVFNQTEWLWLGGDAGSAADNANGTGATAAATIGCYGGPNNSAGDPSCTNPAAATPFLHATGVHNARILQLGLKFIF